MAKPPPCSAKMPHFVPLDIFCVICSISVGQLDDAIGFVHPVEWRNSERLMMEKGIDHEA